MGYIVIRDSFSDYTVTIKIKLSPLSSPLSLHWKASRILFRSLAGSGFQVPGFSSSSSKTTVEGFNKESLWGPHISHIIVI